MTVIDTLIERDPYKSNDLTLEPHISNKNKLIESAPILNDPVSEKLPNSVRVENSTKNQRERSVRLVVFDGEHTNRRDAK